MFQLVIDCADPARMVRFWAPAPDCEVEPPPDGFATWNAYWLSLGVPADEIDQTRDGSDSIRDPAGHGPWIWFQQVPDAKVGKNRLHLDVDAMFDPEGTEFDVF